MFLLLGAHCLIHGLHKSSHIAHSKKSSHEWARLKRLQIFKMFSRSQEHNRTFCSGDGTQRATSFRVSIKLGNNDWTDFDSLLKSLCLWVASLANGAIHDKNARVWLNGGLHLNHLVKESRLLSVTTRSVDNDNLVVVLVEISYASFSDLHRVCLLLVTVKGTLNLGCIHLKLCKSASPESVSAHNTDSPSLFHVVICKFGASGSFSSTLQTNKHDYIWFGPLKFIRFVFAVQHWRQLIYHRRLDNLTKLWPAHFSWLLQRDLCFDRISQFCDVLDVHITC